MGLVRAGGCGLDRVGPTGSAQERRIRFLFFLNIFSAKQIPEKILETVLRHEKYSESPKNFRKIPKGRLRHEKSK
jgi:hypothetical protein